MMSALGDAVHVLPVANALKRHNPAMHLTWVMQGGPARLVRGHPAVDDIIIFERGKGLGAFMDIRRALAGREFDLVLALQVYFKAGIVTSFTRAPVKLGFDRARARDLNWLFTNRRIPPHPEGGQHVQDQYFEFLRAIGVEPEPVSWNLGPWPQERDAQRAFFAKLVRPAASIVIGTSKPDKDWPAERWAGVIDALYDDFGLQPVVVGGKSPRELAALEIINTHARHKPIDTLGASLRDLVGILEGSALVLSPDTGPLHMAVALGTPVIGLFGYTNPRRVGPYRRFGDLVIDAYGDPGENYPVSMETRPGRMSRISVDDVLGKVRLWKSAYADRPPRPA
jgi:heptosyltransferase I